MWGATIVSAKAASLEASRLARLRSATEPDIVALPAFLRPPWERPGVVIVSTPPVRPQRPCGLVMDHVPNAVDGMADAALDHRLQLFSRRLD